MAKLSVIFHKGATKCLRTVQPGNTTPTFYYNLAYPPTWDSENVNLVLSAFEKGDAPT
jgi:hypothetical protein